MKKRLTKQRGGITWSVLKLMVMLIIVFLLTRTDAHLKAKYELVPPPITAVNPATPDSPKEK